MVRRFAAILLGVVIAGTAVGHVALAASDNNDGKSGFKRAFKFHGTLSSVDGDGDSTPGPFVVTPTKASGNGKRYLAANPGDVTVVLEEGTKLYGAADDASDFVVGDAVKVKVKNTASGLVAKKVKLKGADAEEPEPTV